MPGAPDPIFVELPFADLGLQPFGFVLLALTAGVALLCVVYGLRSSGGMQFFALVLFFLVTAGLLFIVDNLVLFYVLWEVEALFVWAVGQNAVRDEEEGPAVLPVQLAGALASLALLASFILLHTGSGNTFSINALRPEGNEWLGPVLLVALVLKTVALAGYSWRGGPQPLAAASGAFIVTAGAFVVGLYPYSRLVLGIFGAHVEWRELALWIGLVGAAVLCLAALGEQDVRRIISYVALAQVLLLFAALALPNRQGLAGAVLLLGSFTFSCTALFVALGTVELRAGAQRLGDLGGLAAVAPGGAALFALSGLTLVGLPPLGGFIGQTLLTGTYLRLTELWPAATYALAVVLGALALLRLFRGVFLGPINNSAVHAVAAPVSSIGGLVLLLLMAGMALAGFAPFWATGVIDPVVLTLLG
ncbi:MAG: proton-conducting transporter transmembrane domain-containing protein [Chloroflexota bacterium]